MGKVGHTGFTRVVKAWGFSMQGFHAVWKHEAAFRQELIMAAILLPASFWISRSPVQMALLLFSVFLVLIVELLNSSIEAVVDRIGTEPHELSGRAKDIGSAAVFLSLLNMLVIWTIIVWNNFIWS